MCRLLGVVSAEPGPIASLVRDEMAPFLALSSVHDHGWGVGWIDGQGSVDVRKAPVRASESTELADLSATTHTDAALLHLRQASPAMPLVMHNTHPFLADGYAFEHNGYAWPGDDLDELLVADDAPAPTGDTDSERYFSLLRVRLQGCSAPDALRSTAVLIAERARTTSLNCLLLGPDALYALAWWDASSIRAQPDGETERDYRLWYRVEQDRVVVASTGIPSGEASEWRELPHGTVLEVRRGTLQTTLHGH